MSGIEWTLPGAHDAIAAAVPDRVMLICGDVRRTHREVAERSAALAAFFGSRGIGVRRERADLERWENGQDPVALVLDNCAEYIESMYGAYRARAVPFNVNQHYKRTELAGLFADVGLRAAVYHRRYGPLLNEACDLDGIVLVDVDDGSGIAPLAGSTNFEDATGTSVASLPRPSPDDLYMVCTGGTTGRPKAVLWRQADIFVSAMTGPAGATAESLSATATANTGGPWFATPPLMHAAAQWAAFSGLHGGAAVLLHDDSKPFDAATILGLVERERAHMMTTIGDAYVRPIVDELRRRSYDLSSLKMIGTGGAFTSDHLKDALLELVPHLMILDGYGASETGGMAFGARTAGTATTGFNPGAGAAVISADRTRFLEPGDDEIGWTARRGRVPLGYLGDREKTETTFPIIDGERVAVPGDRARLTADGRIEMLGRDSMVVNSGGEKIFIEEVELAARSHPDVLDALVVGRPSDRFGQEVVAVVSTRPGAAVDPAGLREHVANEIARFKAPRAVLVCDEVRRLANGKGDYAWAKEVAAAAVDATGGS